VCKQVTVCPGQFEPPCTKNVVRGQETCRRGRTDGQVTLSMSQVRSADQVYGGILPLRSKYQDFWTIPGWLQFCADVSLEQ
jgi:hypothetical protein